MNLWMLNNNDIESRDLKKKKQYFPNHIIKTADSLLFEIKTLN